MKRVFSIGFRLLALSVLTATSPSTAAPPPTEPANASALESGGVSISLRSRTVKLNVEDPAQQSVGRLLWRGGLELISDDAGFGGLSALWMSQDARRAVAVSDEGRWVSFHVAYDDDGTLASAGSARLGPLREPDGRSLAGLKDWGDAEALAVLPTGDVLVAFERQHRLNRYSALPPVALPDQSLLPGDHPPEANEGVESLVALPGGGLLAISEGLTAEVEGKRAWQGFVTSKETFSEWRGFQIPQDADLAPVDAQIGPDQRYLYWLERGFSIIGGVRVKLKRAPLDRALAGTLLRPEELAFLKAPLAVDNIEGLWLRRGPAGETLITLLSDDNFSPLQRTLLLQFELIQ